MCVLFITKADQALSFIGFYIAPPDVLLQMTPLYPTNPLGLKIWNDIKAGTIQRVGNVSTW